jgi:hypothetical protein
MNEPPVGGHETRDAHNDCFEFARDTYRANPSALVVDTSIPTHAQLDQRLGMQEPKQLQPIRWPSPPR